MANDVLCLMLYEAEEDKTPIPAPSKIQDIHTTGDAFVTLVSCDTLDQGFQASDHNPVLMKVTLQ